MITWETARARVTETICSRRLTSSYLFVSVKSLTSTLDLWEDGEVAWSDLDCPSSSNCPRHPFCEPASSWSQRKIFETKKIFHSLGSLPSNNSDIFPLQTPSICNGLRKLLFLQVVDSLPESNTIGSKLVPFCWSRLVSSQSWLVQSKHN